MKHYGLGAVVRSLVLSILIIILTAGSVLAVSQLITKKLEIKSYPEEIPVLSDDLRALTVKTKNNVDFPSSPGLPTKELKNELDKLVEFADTFGYNAIFFETVSECDAFYQSKILPSSSYWTGKQGGFTFFDPLKYLTNTSKEHEIQVYAVIDPFTVNTQTLTEKSPAADHPDWITNNYLNPAEPGVQKLTGKIVDELTSNYDIAGVVLSGIDSSTYKNVEHYSDFVARVSSNAHHAIRQKEFQRLGMVVNSASIQEDSGANLAENPLQKGNLDFVAVASSGEAGSESFSTQLNAWKELCTTHSTKNQPIDFYTLHTANKNKAYDHTIDDSYYFEKHAGAAGIVVSHYSALNTEDSLTAYSLAATFSQIPSQSMPELSYPKTFSITRPEQTLTLDSSWQSYFITGTSKPDEPIFYQGAEIQRYGENGLWGIQVPIAYGTNTYTFQQGDLTKTVTINRNQPGGSAPISTIVKSSVYPSNQEAVLYGDSLKLSCIAPSGGTVTATVAGITQTLTQVAPAQDGLAATYQAVLDVTALTEPGQIKNIGPVTYQLNYAGMNNTQQSAGEVYVAGNGAAPVAGMKTFVVPVNQNAANDGEYATILKQGCVDYITENTGGYYKLAFGGYILKSAVELLDGVVTAENTVSAMSIAQMEKGEQLTITGTARPAFTSSMEDGKLTVTLFHINGFENMNTARLQSSLCDSIDSSIDEETDSVTLTFDLKDTTDLLGWDVQFKGNDTVIYLRQRPQLQLGTAKPLTGISVVIDPGHGGSDPGAPGVPYQSGAWEKTLNLANAYALQSRLQALGAQVTLTQEDETMTLNDRMALAQAQDADVFLSCHHNSLSETIDSNTVAGIEIYYYNNQSASFAENIGAQLSELTGRKLRFTEQSWYRVTMMTACPSVLVESGFLCNPKEYEKMSNEFAMNQYANAVTDAIFQLFL